MSWVDFSRRYHLKLEGGYRYLDSCGAFMIEAEESLDLIPSEDTKPTGARMEKPEQGVIVTLDASQINVQEEMSGSGDEAFVSLALTVGDLALRHVEPRSVAARTFRLSSFLPADTVEQAMSYTVEVNKARLTEWADRIGMSPSHQKLDYVFSSGSLDVNVVLSVTTFENITVQRLATRPRASKWQQKRAERFNLRADNLHVPAHHVVMLEVGISEFDPPSEGGKALFEQLRKIDRLIKETLPGKI
ncbi:MAG TPA: hypothetical protein VIS99_03630 [Terrimicrobiaceae bacterium]